MTEFDPKAVRKPDTGLELEHTYQIVASTEMFTFAHIARPLERSQVETLVHTQGTWAISAPSVEEVSNVLAVLGVLHKIHRSTESEPARIEVLPVATAYGETINDLAKKVSDAHGAEICFLFASKERWVSTAAFYAPSDNRVCLPPEYAVRSLTKPEVLKEILKHEISHAITSKVARQGIVDAYYGNFSIVYASDKLDLHSSYNHHCSFDELRAYHISCEEKRMGGDFKGATFRALSGLEIGKVLAQLLDKAFDENVDWIVHHLELEGRKIVCQTGFMLPCGSTALLSIPLVNSMGPTDPENLRLLQEKLLALQKVVSYSLEYFENALQELGAPIEKHQFVGNRNFPSGHYLISAEDARLSVQYNYSMRMDKVDAICKMLDEGELSNADNLFRSISLDSNQREKILDAWRRNTLQRLTIKIGSTFNLASASDYCSQGYLRFGKDFFNSEVSSGLMDPIWDLARKQSAWGEEAESIFRIIPFDIRSGFVRQKIANSPDCNYSDLEAVKQFVGNKELSRLCNEPEFVEKTSQALGLRLFELARGAKASMRGFQGSRIAQYFIEDWVRDNPINIALAAQKVHKLLVSQGDLSAAVELDKVVTSRIALSTPSTLFADDLSVASLKAHWRKTFEKFDYFNLSVLKQQYSHLDFATESIEVCRDFFKSGRVGKFFKSLDYCVAKFGLGRSLRALCFSDPSST